MLCYLFVCYSRYKYIHTGQRSKFLSCKLCAKSITRTGLYAHTRVKHPGLSVKDVRGHKIPTGGSALLEVNAFFPKSGHRAIKHFCFLQAIDRFDRETPSTPRSNYGIFVRQHLTPEVVGNPVKIFQVLEICTSASKATKVKTGLRFIRK